MNPYKVTYSMHRKLWLVMNNTTNSVHSWWESESKAVATMMDLNRWASMATAATAQALKDKLPSNVIPFRPKKVVKTG
jgi:hypothetical protein